MKEKKKALGGMEMEGVKGGGVRSRRIGIRGGSVPTVGSPTLGSLPVPVLVLLFISAYSTRYSTASGNWQRVL